MIHRIKNAELEEALKETLVHKKQLEQLKELYIRLSRSICSSEASVLHIYDNIFYKRRKG